MRKFTGTHVGKSFFASIFTAILAIAITFTLNACGGGDSNSDDSQPAVSSSGGGILYGGNSSSSGTETGKESSSSVEMSSNGNSSSSVNNSSSSGSSSSYVLSSSSSGNSSSSVSGSSSSDDVGSGLCEGFVNGTKRMHYGMEKEQFCDKRDGNKYVYVTIGDQTWMAENMKYEHRLSMCYGGMNPSGTSRSRIRKPDGIWGSISDEAAQRNCDKYGRLYDGMTGRSEVNYKAMISICPEGYRLPSSEDWLQLINYVDHTTTYTDSYNTTAHEGINDLRATNGWTYYTDDKYGFSALPGGYCGGDASAYNDCYGIPGEYYRGPRTQWLFTADGLIGHYELYDIARFVNGISKYSYIRCLKD